MRNIIIDKSERILNRVQEHYNYLVASGYEVVFTALQGSQNYGLDEYTQEYMSDVDTKSVVLPSLEDFVKAKSPISTVEVLDNDEHAEVKDIRVMFEMFKKMNISYIELLFSDYVVINPKYKEYVELLFSYKNLIASADKIQFVKCIAGMAYEKQKALCHPYPGIIEKIEKYGYDGKQVSHAVRLWEFISKYEAGTPVPACYKSEKKLYLMALKKQQYEDGTTMPVQDAIEICDVAVAAIKEIKDRIVDALTTEDYEPDYATWKILDKIKEAILTAKITEDAAGGSKPLWFSQRKELAATFDKWAEDNGVAKTPFNVITFLEIEGRLK